MPRPQHVPFVLRGCALLIRRFIALFAFGISLLSSGVAIAQTPPAPVPAQALPFSPRVPHVNAPLGDIPRIDRKSTRLNSSHTVISYAVFCLKKKKQKESHNHQQELHEYEQLNT